MALIHEYIRCEQCNRKIYHDDELLFLIDANENGHYYCSLICANEALHFMDKAENLVPQEFYNAYDPMQDKPFAADLANNQLKIDTYSENLRKALKYIRAKAGIRLYDMAKKLNIESAELSQLECGHEQDWFKVKSILTRIADEYDLSKNDYQILMKAFRNTYKLEY